MKWTVTWAPNGMVELLMTPDVAAQVQERLSYPVGIERSDVSDIADALLGGMATSTSHTLKA